METTKQTIIARLTECGFTVNRDDFGFTADGTDMGLRTIHVEWSAEHVLVKGDFSRSEECPWDVDWVVGSVANINR